MPPPASTAARRAVEQERLEQVLSLFESILTNPDEPRPALLALGGSLADDGQAELGIRPLEADPYTELSLAAFPPGTWAVGVLSLGWASGMADENGDALMRPSTAPDRVRSRTVLLVGLSGARASCTCLGDGRRIDTFPEGAMVDAVEAAVQRLRRSAARSS